MITNIVKRVFVTGFCGKEKSANAEESLDDLQHT